MAAVGNPSPHIPTLAGGILGASALMTKDMGKQIEKLDFPGISEFIEMIHDTGTGLFACRASVELFGMEREDLIDELHGITTVGEFYEKAASVLVNKVRTRAAPRSREGGALSPR